MLLVSSCQDYSEFKNIDGHITIVPAYSTIDDLKVVKWRVGPRRKQLISKGIEIKIRLPVLEKEHLNYLINKSEVNAWLVTVRRNNLVRASVMERTYIPLVVPGTDKSKFSARIRQMKNGYIRIYYADAAVSTRYASFPCPVFQHNKLIKKIEIEQLAAQNTPIILRPYNKDKVLSRVNEFNYRPEPINGDKSLEGRYSVEIALYNSKTKTILSNSYKFPQLAKVVREVEVPVTGCQNFKVPSLKESGGIKEFKFGR
ncbi:MAG: hypothetical protein KC493_09650 [Bacteriovoracaceae bacterium]|nr:hypothetical protein [Bacteriovoracaceae bacterium]